MLRERIPTSIVRELFHDTIPLPALGTQVLQQNIILQVCPMHIVPTKYTWHAGKASATAYYISSSSGPSLLASYQGLGEALREFPKMFLSSCKKLLGKMRLIYLTSAYPTLKGQKEHTILCTKRSTTLRTPLSITHSAGSRFLGLAKHIPLSGPSSNTYWLAKHALPPVLGLVPTWVGSRLVARALLEHC